MPHNNNRGDTNVLKAAAQAVLVFITVLLAASVIFYKQRMLFIDAPHVLFRIINDGDFKISDFRYGSFITQLFPLACARLHVPLKCLMVLYSASFYLFYLTVCLLLVYKYKNYGLAILFGLYLFLFVSDTFYWPNNEVHQGIAWLMAAFAVNFYVAGNKRALAIAIPIFILSFYLALWTHPLVMLVAVYLWFFLWMGKAAWPYTKVQSIIYSLILLSLSYLKYNQGKHHGYDSTKIEVVTGFQAAAVRSIFSSPQLHFFLRGCVTNYWLFAIIFIAGIVCLIKDRKYLLLLWTLVFAGGYLALVCITFWDGGSFKFYIESEYMPLSVICSAPFVYFILPKLTKRGAAITIAAVCLIRLVYILGAAPLFINRVKIENSMLDKMKEKNLTKIIIPAPVQGVDSALVVSWAAPVESILLSAIKGDSPQRTFIFANGNDVSNDLKTGKDTLVGCWDLRGPAQVNHHYFTIDTSVSYKVITYNELMK